MARHGSSIACKSTLFLFERAARSFPPVTKSDSQDYLGLEHSEAPAQRNLSSSDKSRRDALKTVVYGKGIKGKMLNHVPLLPTAYQCPKEPQSHVRHKFEIETEDFTIPCDQHKAKKCFYAGKARSKPMGGVYNEIHTSCFGTIRKAKGPVFFERDLPLNELILHGMQMKLRMFDIDSVQE
ncbi:hypothetical protein E5288_WYG009940 [Bos mutus]|uniref:Uncharacterized protein n=1 Tax=Bos mutus TaxID=72004 RepID=A0A6B0SD11_9CETA|nr:hypothetical protein [Bos mutus]